MTQRYNENQAQIKAMMDAIEDKVCWYPLAACSKDATEAIEEPCGPVKYCSTHAVEMRQRYAEGK